MNYIVKSDCISQRNTGITKNTVDGNEICDIMVIIDKKSTHINKKLCKYAKQVSLYGG